MRLGALYSVLLASVAYATEPSEQATAVAAYEAALKHYNLAEYELAIDEFKTAYRLTQAPELLYNIAQAYRLKGAVGVYSGGDVLPKLPRAAPTRLKRAAAEAAVKDLERCAAAEAAAEEAANAEKARLKALAEAALPVAPNLTLTTLPAEPARRPWVLGVTAASTAALLVGGAALFGWTKADYDVLTASGCAPGCNQGQVNALRTRQTVSVALFTASAVAAVTGFLVWWFARVEAP